MADTKSKPDSLGFVLGDISRLMRRAFRDRLEGSSLTPAQAKALIHISRNEGIRQVDLAEMLEVQPITLVRVIDELAKVGAVERRSDPADRRAYRLHLTKGATPHLAAIHQVADAIQAEAMRGLGKKDAAALYEALVTMRATMSAR